MYTEKVMDHFEHPRNVGELENPSGVGTVGNPKCGDIMRIYLDIDENQIIRDVKFKTFGCGAAVATSSMATELVKGKTVQEAMQDHGAVLICTQCDVSYVLYIKGLSQALHQRAVRKGLGLPWWTGGERYTEINRAAGND